MLLFYSVQIQMLWRLEAGICSMCFVWERWPLLNLCLCSVAGCPADERGPRQPSAYASSRTVLFFPSPFLQRIACVNTEPGEGSRRGGHTKWQLNRHDPHRLRRSLAVTVSAEKKRGDANKHMAVDMICVPPTAIKPADLTNRSTRRSQTLPSYLCVLTTECIQGSRACWDAKGL